MYVAAFLRWIQMLPAPVKHSVSWNAWKMLGFGGSVLDEAFSLCKAGESTQDIFLKENGVMQFCWQTSLYQYISMPVATELLLM